MKAEGHNVLKLRKRALETNVPSVDYVPIDPAVDGMTSAGVLALEHLRSMLDTVVYVAKSAQGSDERLARIRFVFEDGRLRHATVIVRAGTAGVATWILPRSVASRTDCTAIRARTSSCRSTVK